VDSTPDANHVYHFALAVRYINKAGVPVERFLNFTDDLPPRKIYVSLYQKPSLLEHIYYNDFMHELQPGILQYDISGHHPIFLWLKQYPNKRN